VVGFYPRAMSLLWSTALYPNAGLPSPPIPSGVNFNPSHKVTGYYRRARRPVANTGNISYFKKFVNPKSLEYSTVIIPRTNTKTTSMECNTSLHFTPYPRPFSRRPGPLEASHAQWSEKGAKGFEPPTSWTEPGALISARKESWISPSGPVW
jgi:hypothetical protein